MADSLSRLNIIGKPYHTRQQSKSKSTVNRFGRTTNRSKTGTSTSNVFKRANKRLKNAIQSSRSSN